MSAPSDNLGRPIVVVTGMGVVTSLGAGKEDNWRKLTAGESGIRTVTRFPIDGLKSTMAGTVDFVTVDPVTSTGLTERLAEMATQEALGQVGEHDRCQYRQQLLDQIARLTTTEAAAESLRHLILIGAEDVADDLLTVIGIHLAKIDSAIDQITRVLAERSGQRPGASGILGVGLHSTKQRRDCLTRHLFGGCLVNSELRGKLIHRNVGQDVIYSTHHLSLSASCRKAAPGQDRRAFVATL